MKTLPRGARVRIFLAVIGVSTILLGTSYGLVQQSTRLAVDDLPLASAQTIKYELESGASPADVVPALKTNSQTDTTVFAIVTDTTPNILASSFVDAKTSLPPKGVFEYTAKHGTDRFTWETGAGARVATRVLTYKYGSTQGYIITGQSLSQAENRISTYGLFTLVGWLMVLAWSFLLLWGRPV